MQPYGLVFAGGGAKGAYEMGVWKALRDMDIPICAVVGASIGALNGALLAQGDFDKAMRVWRDISMEQVLNLGKPLEGGGNGNLLDFRNLETVAREALAKGGLDTTPLRQLIQSVVDEGAVRASSVDLGVTLFSLTSHASVEVFLEDIPEGQLADYLLASASFPIFRKTEIGEEAYVDGGVGNNMPTGMLIGRGIQHIIEVDICGVGWVPPVDLSEVRVVELRPSLPIGATFDLTPSVLEHSFRVGELDTLKAFGRLEGDGYFFQPDDYHELLRLFGARDVLGLQEAAKIYGVPQEEVYTLAAFVQALQDKRQLADQAYPLDSERIGSFLEDPLRAVKNLLGKNGQEQTTETEAGRIRLSSILEIMTERRLKSARKQRSLTRVFQREYTAASAVLALEDYLAEHPGLLPPVPAAALPPGEEARTAEGEPDAAQETEETPTAGAAADAAGGQAGEAESMAVPAGQGSERLAARTEDASDACTDAPASPAPRQDADGERPTQPA
jgi:predicted acylesterase/phospholipase RssA